MKYCGVDYYPEQWGLKLLDQDLKDIKGLGANLIRIADFAWDVFEPEEGVFDFTFFDEVIAKMKAEGFKILMCIPTATMPNWLYKKYPEIMNESIDGYRQPYGARRGYCYNSDIYLEKARKITFEIVNHYKNEDAIVAYQVDNEIGHEGSDVCYCSTCENKFRDYLRSKYITIEELNERWGTHFWSQTYRDFDDIYLPRKSFVAQNPSLRLEYARFRALSAENFIGMLADTVRSLTDVPVTHDFEGGTINKCFNPFRIAEHLDFVSYNNYPVWGGQTKPLSDSDLAFTVDFARGFKQDKIWITEAIMGAQGHNDIGCAPKPDEAKKWAEDSLIQGVESLIFFRYRGYTKGAEQYCFGIVDSDNEKRRKYYETKAFFEENIDKETVYPKADVCMIYDYDSKSSMEIQRQSNMFSYEKECMKLYGQFYKRHMNVDIIDSLCDFSKYRVVVLPYMIIMSEEFKERLKEYVNNGGTVIMTPRTAWKDTDNNLVFGRRIPVYLEDLTGLKLEEQESLNDDTYYEAEVNGVKGKAYVFGESMEKISARQIGTYLNNPFGKYGCAFVNNYGEGKCYYLSSSFDENLLDEIFKIILGL